MAGKFWKLARLGECVPAFSKKIAIVLPHNFYSQIRGNRLDWVPDFKFSFSFWGDTPQTPLSSISRLTPTNTHSSVPFIYIQHVNVKKDTPKL